MRNVSRAAALQIKQTSSGDEEARRVAKEAYHKEFSIQAILKKLTTDLLASHPDDPYDFIIKWSKDFSIETETVKQTSAETRAYVAKQSIKPIVKKLTANLLATQPADPHNFIKMWATSARLWARENRNGNEETPEVVSVRLGMEFPQTSAKKEEFKTKFVEEVAAALGVKPSLFEVQSLAPGSVIVALKIKHSTSSAPASSLKNELLAQAKDQSSKLFKGELTQHIKSAEPVTCNNKLSLSASVAVGAGIGSPAQNVGVEGGRPASPPKLTVDTGVGVGTKVGVQGKHSSGAAAKRQAAVRATRESFMKQLVNGVSIIRYSTQGAPKRRLVYVLDGSVTDPADIVMYFDRGLRKHQKPWKRNGMKRARDLVCVIPGTKGAGFKEMFGAVVGDQEFCFSLVFDTKTKDGKPKGEMFLSMQAETTEDYQALTTGFESLMVGKELRAAAVRQCFDVNNGTGISSPNRTPRPRGSIR
jgi:hypothetical protein